MINRLEISNFKSILKADLAFGRVNLFIGPNGAGKSNVLEAIGILSSALGRSINKTDLDLRGVRLSLPRLFKATFKYRDIPSTFRLRATMGDIVYQPTISAGDLSSELTFLSESINENGQKVVGRSHNGVRIHKPLAESIDAQKFVNEESGLWPSLGQFCDVSDGSRQLLADIGRYVIYTPQTALMRGLATDPRDGLVEPLGLTGGNLAKALEFLLQSADTANKRKKLHSLFSIVWSPGWADQVSVDRFNPQIVPENIPTLPKLIYIRDKFMKSGRDFLSAYDASEGSLYLIFVASLLAHPEAPRFFALDNVDGTLNPRLVRKLVEDIISIICSEEDNTGLTEDSSGKSQVFLTSHNPTALDAMDLFNPDHKVFIVCRDESQHGATVIRALEVPKGKTKEDWIEAKQGKNLSQLWLDDLIRGAL